MAIQKTPNSIKSLVKTIGNYLAVMDGHQAAYRQGKKDNYYVDDQPLAKFTPEELSSYLDEYRGALNLKDLPGNNAFRKYKKARATSAADLSEIKTSDGQSIDSKLSKSGELGKEVGDAIAAQIRASQETQNAGKAFESNIDAFKKVIENTTEYFSAYNMVDRLHLIKDAAQKSIATQHAQEKKNLADLLELPDFNQKLKTSLGCDDDELLDLRQQMLSALEKNQANALTEFEKSIDDPIKKMHAAARTELMRIAVLARQYENKQNTAFIAEIMELYEKNKKASGLNLEVTLHPNLGIFDGISIKELKTLRSFSGRPIGVTKDGKFTIPMPNRFWANLKFWYPYYLSARNLPEADMTSLAQLVRACDYDKITMNINHQDQQFAIEMARSAYAGCRASDFDDASTTINVNGKKMTAGELFRDCPSRLHKINEEARIAAREIENQEKIGAAKTEPTFKSRLQAYTEEAQQSASTRDDAQLPSDTAGPRIERTR